MSTVTAQCRTCAAPRPVDFVNEKPADGQMVVTACWKACETCGATEPPGIVYAELTTYPPDDAAARKAAEMGA
jgi:hypothetical protein